MDLRLAAGRGTNAGGSEILRSGLKVIINGRRITTEFGG
jgi:hypothetical protein